MLVVFEFESKDHLSEFLGVVAHRNDFENEELDYCLAREKAQEVIACRELNIPYVVLDKPMFFAKGGASTGQAIIDSNVDVGALSSDTRLVVRANTSKLDCEALERFQPFVSAAENEQVSHWPRIIKSPEKYLKRHVSDLPAQAFNGAMQMAALNPPLFIKGVEKGNGFSLHHVFETKQDLDGMIQPASELRKRFGTRVPYEVGDDAYLAYKEMPDWECPFRGQQKGRVYFFEPKDGVIISSVLRFDHQPDHKAEYRCFIVGGKVSSISTYTDYKAHPVPASIEEMARDFAADHASLAPGFVADFGMTDRGPVLVEMNSFSHSGRYVGNDAYALYQDLETHLGVDRSLIKDPDIVIPDDQESDFLHFEFEINEKSDTWNPKRREVDQDEEDVFGLS